MALSRITEAVASFTDLTIGDDLTLTDDFLMASDASIIKFGADADVTLTHVHNTGLLLNSTSVIQFNDSSQNIGAPNATTLDINATDEIELNATLVDVNANLDVSGTYTGAGLMTTGGNIVIPDAGNIGSASDTDAIAISSGGVVTFSQNPVFPDGGIAIADLDIDGGTDIGAALADADLIIVDDGAGGTNRKATLSRLKTYIGASTAADDLTAGDAAVNLTTTSGNITIDAQGNDTDIIFKGTDGSSDTTFLTIDGSAAGEAIFNAGIVIADAGNIGSASDKDAIAIASNGVVTFSQNPVFPDGSISIADLDIDGGTDIGEAIVDADLFIIDNGADGTNRKVAASRIKTYIGASTAADDLTAGDAAVNLTTTSGNITIDAQGNDTDIIFKGTDGSSDTTFLTIDGSEAGKAIFNAGATFADDITITTADNNPQLTLISTDADANRGAILAITRNSGSPADNDIAGTIKFNAKNDADEDIELFEINTTIIDASDGTEDARMIFNGIVAGASTNRLTLNSNEAVFNDDSADIDFRVEGDGSTHALFVQGGTDKVGIGQSAPNDFGTTASNLVIGTTTGDNGLTIVSATNAGGRIQFADNTSSPFRGAFEYDHSSDGMIFYTGGSEGMRLSVNGNLAIGDTTNVAGLKVFKHLQSYNGISIQNGTNNDGNIFQSFLRSNGNVVGSISQTAGGAQVLFNTSSDYRLKENVSDMTDATTRLKQLKPKRFNWIEDDTNTTVDGFLAHEVSSIIPEAITGEKDGTEDLGTVKNKDGDIIEKNVSETHFKERQKETIDLDGNKEDAVYPSTYTWEKTSTENVYQTIDQSKLVPLLVKTIQELEARIKTLEDA